MLELDPRLLCGEAPVYRTFVGVTLDFPSTHFLGKRSLVGDAPIQTLASEHRELDLGHVQPRAVLWGVMDLQPLQQTPSFTRGERLIQSGRGMGVEIVQNQNDLLGIRVVQINQLLYALCPVDLGPPLGDADVTPASQRLPNDEEVGPPIALVLVVVTGGVPRADGEWLPYLSHQLLALLVQANLREMLLVGSGVDLKDILHTPDEGAILLWRDGPLPLEPGLYGTFLRVRRTNSREMGSSAHFSSTKRSARRRTLQRFLPFGGSEQARAIRWASCSPSSFFGLVALGLRWTSAASNPSQANLWRTRATVERLISRASAILVSGQEASWGASSPSSALSRMRAWVNWRAGAWPPEIKLSNLPRSSLDKLTGLFLFLGIERPPHVRCRAAARTSGGTHDTREGILLQTNHVRTLGCQMEPSAAMKKPRSSCASCYNSLCPLASYRTYHAAPTFTASKR